MSVDKVVPGFIATVEDNGNDEVNVTITVDAHDFHDMLCYDHDAGQLVLGVCCYNDAP